MSFINTDDLVVLGAGSEWFWTALSGIALVVTFLAIYRQLRLQQTQMRETTKVLRSQAHYNAEMLGQRPLEMLIDDKDLADVVTTGYSAPGSLSEADWFRCSNYMFLQVNAWEYFYYQSRDNSIPKELWVGANAYFRDLVSASFGVTRPGMARFWSEYREAFDEPFRGYVDAEFAKRPTAPESQPKAEPAPTDA